MRKFDKKIKNTDDLRDVWYFIYQHCNADSLRLRASVIWISENISYDIKGARTDDPRCSQLNYVLKHKKAICAGYAYLLKYFCDLFRIDCRIINGRARSSEKAIYIGGSSMIENHAWNMVKINNQWRFIDPTWVSGAVTEEIDDPKAKYVKEFNETYYFTPPAKLILNHFPKQSQFQLLSPAIKENVFKSSPLFTTQFLEDSILQVIPSESLIKARVGDTLIFKLKTKTEISEMVGWSPLQEKAKYQANVIREGDWIQFKYPVTISGSFSFYLRYIANGYSTGAIIGYKLQIAPKNRL
jgi:transglutaminase/protease-like cytokinesis protein 3